MTLKYCPHCGKLLPTEGPTPAPEPGRGDICKQTRDGVRCTLPRGHVCPHSFELDDVEARDDGGPLTGGG